MTIEVEIREIKEMLEQLNKKLDSLVHDRETLGMMIMSQQSLKDFLESEPEIYSVKDVKVAYT
jgi:hypothetical protein